MKSLPTISKTVQFTLTARQQAIASRQAARLARETRGLSGGEKVGKHRIKTGEVEVQLGEDLSENLRGLKVSYLFTTSLIRLIAEVY